MSDTPTPELVALLGACHECVGSGIFTDAGEDDRPCPSCDGSGFDTGPWIESMVDDAMIERALAAYHAEHKGTQREWMRSALLAALKGVNND